MIKKIIEHKLLKTVVELIVLGIFAWTFTVVRDLPGVYITKVEAHQIRAELKDEIKMHLAPIRSQVQSIYDHLIKKKEG